MEKIILELLQKGYRLKFDYIAFNKTVEVTMDNKKTLRRVVTNFSTEAFEDADFIRVELEGMRDKITHV